MQSLEHKSPGEFIDRIREIKDQIKEIQLQNFAESIHDSTV
jgi:hypothetical protein